VGGSSCTLTDAPGAIRTAGFDGFVVSDYDAWANLVTTHHYASDFTEAAALGINAGMDQEGGFGAYAAIDAMPNAVAAGNVSHATVVSAFRRLMRIRLRLGMLDPPSSVRPMDASTYNPDAQCQTDEKLALARRAARDGIVMLKNAAGALPLARDALLAAGSGSLALVGPQADDWRILVGAANYAFADGPSRGVVTILKGLQHALSTHSKAMPPSSTLRQHMKLTNGSSTLNHVDGCATVACASADVAAATAAATAARATVLLLGDWFGSSTGWPLCEDAQRTDGCESEAHDREAIELPGKQVRDADVMSRAPAVTARSSRVCVCVAACLCVCVCVCVAACV
jgi:beta-glucosidase